MNYNLKILDLVDRSQNIYEWICERAKRAHEILSGASTAALAHEKGIAFLVMEEFLHSVQKSRTAELENPGEFSDASTSP